MAKHLTLEQRELLHVFFEKNMKQFCIAKKLGIHQSTISRELKRNKLSKNKYSPSNAFYWYKLRKIWSKQNIPKWHEKPELLKYVVERLRLYWSPDQISKRIRLDFPNDKFMRINHESIYQYIWKNKKQDGSLYKYLRFSHIKRKNHEKAIATYVERKTKILLAMKVESKQAEEMTKATIKAFKSIPEEFKLTMTHDNGKEIAQHEIITKNTHMIVYCANPYHSWERGLNENTNGLIRQFLPKKTDFTRITQKDVDLIVRLINNRPRKSLNYHTPFEVFSSLTNYAFQT